MSRPLKIGEPGFREALKRAFDTHGERNTFCPDRCRHGYINKVPLVIDTYTGEPHTEHCPTCKGTGFVPRQLELFPDYKASPDNE